MKSLLLMISALLMMVSCHGVTKATPAEAVDTIQAGVPVPSLDDDIAQMLLVGFRGMSLDDNNHIVRDIRDYHIGGVILFEYDAPSGRHYRNIMTPAQVKKLCTQLQELHFDALGSRGNPLLISIDQEGGSVCRLKRQAGFAPLPSAQAMGKGGIDSVRHYAGTTAEMLEELGINLNFAPCVDVNVNPNCPIIGKLGRSFSSEASEVAALAQAWIEVSDSMGIISCPKHFPGHGSSSGDSHQGLVDVSRTWKACELEPYRTLIASGKVRMIMTTHVINRQLDASGLPATLSEKVLTGLLRDSLGFEGVIITDDMGMGAIANEYGYKEALWRAISAGADLLCLGNNSGKYNPEIVPETIALIKELVAEGRLSAGRIHESAERVRGLWADKQ